MRKCIIQSLIEKLYSKVCTLLKSCEMTVTWEKTIKVNIIKMIILQTGEISNIFILFIPSVL